LPGGTEVRTALPLSFCLLIIVALPRHIIRDPEICGFWSTKSQTWTDI